MSELPALTRRQLLQAGLIGGLGLAIAGAGAPAFAGRRGVTVTDLGVGVETFTMFATASDGETVYLSSRNVEPMQVVAFHVPTATITSVTDVYGESTQALAVEPNGRYVYGCVRINFGDNVVPVSRLFRIDMQTPSAPVLESLHEIEGLIPFSMTVSPDGVVFFTGRGTRQGVQEYDPATGALRVLANPDPTAQYGRSVAATETTVYFGLRGVHPTTGATVAGLYAVDRATGQSQSILPAGLARAPEVRDISVVGEQLVVVNGSIGAIIDIADPQSHTLLRAPLNIGRSPLALGGRIYFFGNGGIAEYDPATKQFRQVVALDTLGTIFGIHAIGDEIAIASAYGLVAVLEPLSGAMQTHDLVALGAPTGPQLAMSIAHGAGAVFVGGTHTIARHDVRSGAVENLLASGEAKDMMLLDERLYTCQYSNWGVMGFDPSVDDRYLRQLATAPDGQNRPHDLLWDGDRQRFYIGSGSDAKFYGAVWVFDPATGAIESYFPNPFGDNQQVRTLARDGSTLFLGGEKAGASQIMAWSLDTQSELWRISLDPAPRAICGLVVQGGRLYALGHSGAIVVIDIATQRILSQVSRPDLIPDWGSLTVRGGRVYGVSAATFFRLDRRTFEPEVLVGDLAADWYGVPRVAVHGNRFYAIRGRNLIRIDGA